MFEKNPETIGLVFEKRQLKKDRTKRNELKRKDEDVIKMQQSSLCDLSLDFGSKISQARCTPLKEMCLFMSRPIYHCQICPLNLFF